MLCLVFMSHLRIDPYDGDTDDDDALGGIWNIQTELSRKHINALANHPLVISYMGRVQTASFSTGYALARISREAYHLIVNEEIDEQWYVIYLCCDTIIIRVSQIEVISSHHLPIQGQRHQQYMSTRSEPHTISHGAA